MQQYFVPAVLVILACWVTAHGQQCEPCSGRPEQEVCGEDTNGGCNVSPPQFEIAMPGEVICGTAWFNGKDDPWTRDTDWYLVDVPDPDGDGTAILCAELASSFPATCLIVDISDCDSPVVIGDVGCARNCMADFPAAACVDAPGQYAVFVASGYCLDGFEHHPCGTFNDYTLCINVADDCDDPCPGCPPQCPADLTGDGTVAVNDLLDLLAGWNTPDADIDGDNDTDVDDLLALLAAWGPCS